MTLSEFWHNLTTSRYVRLLEQNNRQLREENESLKLALFPALQRIRAQRAAESVNGSGAQPQSRTDQKLGGKSGEKTEPVRLHRPSWSEARARIEYLTDAELRESERLQKVKEKYQ